MTMELVAKPLPTKQEEIRAALDEAQEEMKRIRTEEKLVRIRIEAIRELCEHPRKDSGNTWGRWPWTRCLVCGKEW